MLMAEVQIPDDSYLAWTTEDNTHIMLQGQVTDKRGNYKLDILRVSEARFGFGSIKIVDEKTILYSGRDGRHQGGGALILNEKARGSFIG
ncbi:hypothetical protein CEXT_12501 [Caerostris extrusa]|uniref:Uncharacterized protein n=1 Tax=Caerostris extrusa TaxID=172846 RepID=A0AAV4PAG3_CAEEX|nr:hypothetical protein CEXT_12501 [Caerostris extrusa]